MAARLSNSAVERAIDHIIHFGDTDVFPHLFEIAFLKERRAEVIDEVTKLDLDSFSPNQAIETIAPKSRYGFRVVHQLPILETLLFTACLIEIAPDLAAAKGAYNGYGPFAYHYDSRGGGSLFKEGRSYHDWLQWQKQELSKSEFDHIIHTDIADFDQRIYYHRVENTLDTLSSNKGVNRYICRTIKAIRSHQSYGIPIGGSASRLLAEAILTDLDAALTDEGIIFTRFVDDYRIFVKEGQDPYRILSQLAEQIYSSEGLTLNAHKTAIHGGKYYLVNNIELFKSAAEKADEAAIEALSAAVYFDENPPEIILDQLRTLNLVEMLQAEIDNETWNFSRIRSILRALRFSASEDASDYLVRNIWDFQPFAKELLFYFDEYRKGGGQIPSELSARLIEIAQVGAASAIPATKAWILEFFVRGICYLPSGELSRLEDRHPMVERQILLIRGLREESTYFRRNKNAFDNIGGFVKPAFIVGATCLPSDELSSWLSAIRPRMQRPLDQLFTKWVSGKSGQLVQIIANSRITAFEN